jgi:hypothetical protein
VLTSCSEDFKHGGNASSWQTANCWDLNTGHLCKIYEISGSWGSEFELGCGTCILTGGSVPRKCWDLSVKINGITI